MTKPVEAIGQHLPVIPFILLYKMVLFLKSVQEILSVTTQIKALKQNFPVALFTVQCDSNF